MKRNLLILNALFFILISCKHDSMNTQQEKLHEFGQRYTEAWNSQNPENVASFFSEQGALIVNEGEPYTGRNEITEFTKGFMDAFPDLQLTMDSLVQESSFTDYHWSFIGTNTGPGGTGNSVEFSGFERWTLDEEGLIKVSIGTFDEDDYTRQVKGTTD
ncbi:nuclear transport factor 2 family protein [Portibacter marinus]|uniref:nuclear transport factor 2 family protein n=1 Tax=Portibacter marinus TaxID=2898660 RepID=UPI001F31BF87|nr:nuclear transport factor 2 family protein [Portibacter marinus]